MAPRDLLHFPASVEQSTEGEARPPVGRAPSSVYGVPNSNSTLPTRSRQQGDSGLLTCAAENGPWVGGDDGVAWLTSGNGEGALQWSSGSQDVRRSFVELPSSFSTDQLL
jgi:hypothetical protein